jgi:hypothetical protein
MNLDRFDRHFVDMSSFVNYEDFKNIEPEIMAGIAKCKFSYAIEGGWGIYNPKKTIQPRFHKSITEAYTEFKSNDAIPISPVAEWDANKNISLEYKNKMTRYLKSKYGAVDSYWSFQIEENLEYTDVPADILEWERKLMAYFPKTREWVRSLLGPVFKTIKAANILYIENNGIPYEHHDGNEERAFDGDTSVYEFIHFRNPRRGFYILDELTNDKIHAESWAVLWDVRNYHSSTQSIYPDWSLRVDGEFTDAVRDKLAK